MAVVSGQREVSGAAWALWPGVAVSPDGDGFTLRPENREANATFTIEGLPPGREYLLTFRCGNGDLRGGQRVFASAHAGDNWLATYPGGLGFLCPRNADSTEQGFALVVPPGTWAVAVWLRATGTGSATFTDVRLREIR